MCCYGNLEIQTKVGWHTLKSSEFSSLSFLRGKKSSAWGLSFLSNWSKASISMACFHLLKLEALYLCKHISKYSHAGGFGEYSCIYQYIIDSEGSFVFLNLCFLNFATHIEHLRFPWHGSCHEKLSKAVETRKLLSFPSRRLLTGINIITGKQK